MTTQAKLLTVEDLLAMPEEDLRHCELVRGELREMTPTKPIHSLVAGQVAWLLSAYVMPRKMGRIFIAEGGFIVRRNPDTVRVPDLAFVRQERMEAIGKIETFWPEAPDLVVEVVSPTDRQPDVDAKTEDWLAAGARMVLVIEPPQRRVRVYRSEIDVITLTEADMLAGGDVVPGSTVPVAELFV
jgi:Uma2 family endonuclease